MQSKTKKIILILAILFLIALIFCLAAGFFLYKFYLAKEDKQPDKEEKVKITLKLSEAIESFKNDKEFDKYLEEIKKNQDETDKSKESGSGDTEQASPMGEESSSQEIAKDGSITNVQEQGVDEGDIVKVYKDYFVILRRGRIFTVKISESNRNVLEKVSNVDAYPKDFTKGTWFDEMLIYKDKIVVIGYSYEVSATEVGLFSINDRGELAHLNTYFIDSNDYYSSRNYASRLIDNQLILYMPYYLYALDYSSGNYKREVKFPQVKKWIKGDEVSEGKNILKKTDIYKPVQDIDTPTLHTIVSCDIESSGFDCGAKAVMGPYSRNFYVSPNAVYLWVSDVNFYYFDKAEKEKRKNDPSSYVYMIKLDDMSARALRADGTPIDQFSFKEKDNYLNVLVREYSGGDAMWNPEVTTGAVALFRVSLDKFTASSNIISKESYTNLPNVSGYTIQNRYVGDFLLYGTGSNWYQDKESRDILYVKNYTNREEAKTLDLLHSVDRIDLIGENGVVIGMEGEDLKFSSIELSKDVRVKNTYNVGKASQGELRSHGFSYKDNKDGTGILGLPIIRSGESYMSLWQSSAEVLFLKVNKDLGFTKLGSLQGSLVREENDNCQYSCVDWYGNSRPIFYSGRIFGLLGYDLVEGKLEGEEITESGKVNFTP